MEQSRGSDLGNYESYVLSESGAVARFSAGWLEIDFCGEGIVRMQAGPTGASPAVRTYAIVKDEWPKVILDVRETDDDLILSTCQARVVLRKLPGRLEFRDSEDRLLTSCLDMGWGADGFRARHSCNPDEHFYGFGLQFHSFDQRGKTRVLKTNADPPTDNGMAHAVIPFFISTNGYGLLLNSEGYTTFHMAGDEPDVYSFGCPDGGLDYFVLCGGTPKNILKQYTDLTGRAQMPPKWGLGFWYRTPGEWSADKISETMQQFRDAEIPCDVIGLEPGWQTHAYPCSYVWNRERFPDPAAWMHEVREKGFHVNLWEHAYVHSSSPIYDKLKETGCVADREVWTGLVPDFTIKKTGEIFEEHHVAEHVDIGVSGYKLDECDGADFTGEWFFPDDTRFPGGRTGAQMHNLMGFLYQKTFHGMFERLGKRTYLLVRANYTGAQKYASCIYSDYYGLDQYVRAMANSGFSGILWCPELRQTGSLEEFARRTQLMFFSALAMINAWSSASGSTPWEKGLEGQAIFKKYADLRMRLLPYIYSCFRQAHETGVPLIRPLMLDFPEDEKTWTVDDQFMFGDSIMVVPVLGGEERRAYLPDTLWADFWTGETLGGGSHRCESPLDHLPLFVKPGSIIPMYPAMNYVGEKPVEEIEFHVYCPGTPSTFTLYEDDGETTRYLDGEYTKVNVESVGEHDGVYLRLGEPKGSYPLTFRSAAFVMHQPSLEAGRVLLGGRALDEVSQNDLAEAESGWCLDRDSHTVRIKVPLGRETVICVERSASA